MNAPEPTAKRTPGDVLRASRKRDSAAKRAAVVAAVDEMKAAGEPITHLSVAARAKVSDWLVYQPGVREHIEAAAAGQAKAARRGAAAGTRASSASLATDLALAREQIKELRAERDRLKAAVQRGLGAVLETAGTKELTERINQLIGQVERLAGERDAALAANAELAAALAKSEGDLLANRESVRRMMKEVARAKDTRPNK